MDSSEHIRQTLEHYRQQRQRKLEEFRIADNLVRQLEEDLGEPQSAPESLEELKVISAPAEMPTKPANRGVEVRPDEFFAMTQSEAAKAYLRKIGRAISFDQLVEALRKGGAQLGGADPGKTLYVSLARNPLREFVYPNEGVIGLREFYPTLGKVTATRQTQKAKRSQKRKGKKGRGKAKPSKEPAQPNENALAVKDQIKQIMKDGQPRTGDEIVKAVESAMGKVKKIWVYGALRGYTKQEDGKYKAK
jgi:hypothetical protein